MEYHVDDIDVNNNFGNITFEKWILNFHGEIHDIRIYKNTLSEDKIVQNCKNTNNIASEFKT